MNRLKISAAVVFTAFTLMACTVPENEIPGEAISGIRIYKNLNELVSDSGTTPVTRGAFSILEGRTVFLSAQLLPQGIPGGGIHWQSSSRGIVNLSSLTGQEITVTGANGGRTFISVLARNMHNEVFVESECTITVIPSSFFKWSYAQDGWLDMEPYENIIMGTINSTTARSGETPIMENIARGGFVLEGPGILSIGSVLSTPTNSFFPDDPVYDIGGAMDFLNGPAFVHSQNDIETKIPYPLWNGRARISVDYERLSTGPSPLRIQINNNTLERNNASAINNWLAAELAPDSPQSGTLSGIFNARESSLASGITENLADILSSSFVCLALPEGTIVIKNLKIESAD
jgi:hypothetical protein